MLHNNNNKYDTLKKEKCWNTMPYYTFIILRNLQSDNR